MNDATLDSSVKNITAEPLEMSDGWRPWASRVVVAILPVVLALVGYYRAQLAGSPLPRPQGDAAFYAYQLQMAAECHGQWWCIAADRRLGHPYPSEFAKHPGLFEGVDLMLMASLVAGAVSASWAYHLAALAALTVNGWIAAWIVLKFTRKTIWALAAVALITLNESVAVRTTMHLHLFKFGWVLLAVWAFVAFLKRPEWRRGLLLGITVALALQASFHLGFFTGLGLGFWFALELLAGRVRRSALAGTAAAGLAFALSAVLLCFPGLDKLHADRRFGSLLSSLLGRDLDLWVRGYGSMSFPKARGWPPTISETCATRCQLRRWTKDGTFPAIRSCWPH